VESPFFQEVVNGHLAACKENVMKNLKDTALITGVSSGIGAIAADRLAKRGHDLILVARNRERLEAVATRLRGETGRSADVIVGDLTERSDRAAGHPVVK
jgi:hypothetical protein